MEATRVTQASRQQLQDDLLSLIRSRSRTPSATPSAAQSSQTAAAPVGPVQTARAVEEINKALQSMGTNLHFEIDAATTQMVVKVVDQDSGQVLRQIPSEAALQIAASLGTSAGHLINHTI